MLPIVYESADGCRCRSIRRVFSIASPGCLRNADLQERALRKEEDGGRERAFARGDLKLTMVLNRLNKEGLFEYVKRVHVDFNSY